MYLEQISTPALIIDLNRMDANMEYMQTIVDQSNAVLRPHYKSNKCIEVVQRQLARGAKGITCAKLSEAEDLAEAGVEDVLIANQITDIDKIAKVAGLAKKCRLGIAVDHAENVENLEKAAAAQDAVIYCLVEYEIGMKRCGVSTKEELYELAKAIEKSPHLVFEGIQAYAGQLSHELSVKVRREKGEEVEKRLKEAKEYLEEHGVKVNQVSGCSTASVLDHASKDSVYTEFQAGSYIFMDTAYGALTDLKFGNTLFVLATVISKAGGQTITDVGRKAISMDQKEPVFVGYEDYPVKLSEEHSTVQLPADEKHIGDKMLMIPGHCCTCINIYDWVYFVRDGKVVNKVPVTSRGKSQ